MISGGVDSVNPAEAPVRDGSTVAQPGQDPMAYVQEKYWANKPVADIGGELMKKVSGYYEYLVTSGRLQLLQKGYDAYHKGYIRGAKLLKAGQQNEFTLMHANHSRNILQHILNQTTAQKPAFEPRAINTDFKSQAQTIVAGGVVDYYHREKKMERYTTSATELSLYQAEGEVFMDWDPTLGDKYGVNPETGKTITNGDIAFKAFGPIDVIRDWTLTDSVSHNWKIIREFKNKYTMAAKYPAWAERILGLSYTETDLLMKRFGPVITNNSDTDLIPVFKFFHLDTPAVPGGRVVEFMSKDIVTFEGKMPISQIPSYRIAGSDQAGTPFGYTILWDLLPVQEAIDALYSTVVTNQSNFGVQNILMPKGAGISVSKMVGGLNVITYDPKFGKPEALTLLNTPKEIFDLISKLETLMEVLSGVNSVVRGQPEASLKSGAALALVASQAIQFNSGLQKSYTQLLEDTATAVIIYLQKFANTKRVAVIAGKANRTYMKEFTQADISDVGRVTVDVGNPLSRTTAGKVQIAEDLMSKGLLDRPEQYFQVLSTGRLEPAYENEQAQIMLVRAENEKLGDEQSQLEQANDPNTGQPIMGPDGKPMVIPPVHALATDDHVMHIKEHQVVLASPEARANPVIVQNTLAHLQEHMDLLRTSDPLLLSLLGQPVVQAPPSPPDTPPPGKGDKGKTSEVTDASNPVTKEAGKVKQPSMPTNPQTGEKYNPQTGGL